MVNIATLAAVIDPTGAVTGAAAVAAAATSVVAAFRGIQAAQRQLGQGRGGFAALAAAAQASARTIYNAFNRATFGITGLFARMAQNVISDIRAIGSAISGIGRGFATFGLAVQGLQSFLSPVTALMSKAWEFGKEAVGKAANLESTEIAIRNLVGSGEKAKKMMKELMDLSVNTTLEFPDTADAARQLLSYGIAAEKILPAMKRLADLNALTGGKSSIKDLSYLYGTAATQSQLYKRDLNQFANRGIDVISAMALEMKKSKGELMDMVSKGKIGFKELERTIVSMTEKGGIAFNAQNAQMTSWNGMVAKLSEQWDLFLAAVGKPIMDGLKPLLDDLSGMVANLTKQVQDMYPAIKAVVDYIPAAFRVMQQEGGLKLSFQAATDYLWNKMKQVIATSGEALWAVFNYVAERFTAAMKFLASKEFWSGVGEALVEGVKKALDFMENSKRGSAFTDSILKIRDGQSRAEVINEAGASAQQEIYSQMNEAIKAGNQPLVEQLQKNLDGLNRDIEEALPVYARSSSQGPDNMLLPNGPEGPFNFDWQESWNRNDPGMSSAQKEYVSRIEEQYDDLQAMTKAALETQGEIDKEMEASADARNKAMDKLNSGGGGGSAAASAAAKRKAEREDAALGKLASSMLAAASPDEKYQQEMDKIQKLYDANKISIEKKQILEAHAQEQYRLDLEKSVKATEKAARAMETPIMKLAQQWGQLQKNAQQAAVQIAESFSNNISNAIVDVVSGTKSLGEAFADMAQNVIRDIVQIITKLLVQYAISRAIAAVGSGGGGFWGFAAGAIGKVMHTGGDVSAPGPTRLMSGSMLSSARRYHSGGVAGLNAGEVPAILERGEHVLTRRGASEQKRRMLGTGGGKAEKSKPGLIINTLDPRQIMSLLAEHPDAILNVLNLKKQELKRMLA